MQYIRSNARYKLSAFILSIFNSGNDSIDSSGASPGIYLREDPVGGGVQLGNVSEPQAVSAEKAAFYLDAALAARTIGKLFDITYVTVSRFYDAFCRIIDQKNLNSFDDSLKFHLIFLINQGLISIMVFVWFSTEFINLLIEIPLFRARCQIPRLILSEIW